MSHNFWIDFVCHYLGWIFAFFASKRSLSIKFNWIGSWLMAWSTFEKVWLKSESMAQGMINHIFVISQNWLRKNIPKSHSLSPIPDILFSLFADLCIYLSLFLLVTITHFHWNILFWSLSLLHTIITCIRLSICILIYFSLSLTLSHTFVAPYHIYLFHSITFLTSHRY